MIYFDIEDTTTRQANAVLHASKPRSFFSGGMISYRVQAESPDGKQNTDFIGKVYYLKINNWNLPLVRSK